ncbi:hypothetical protein [Erythrobacter litoralis]|uniref:Tryptophan-rich sensory protein n=1 Tax=Erythrobacter litoralis (strain HTCC2594) TaxID=314225 RepID=Q2NDA7_ERYLH|nr:hypothetical protein [Erythrobacter litoralis]ABC62334.1 hypothetical protein ELI_01210 [Erythrobacter litoralis HTCC2594]
MTGENPRQRSLLQRLAILVAVAWQIGATFLPQLGLGEPIGDRSDSVRTLITPSGWAFAIWGPLFFGSAVFALWQILPKQVDNALVAWIGWWAALALAAQGAWATYTQFANLTAISAIIIATSLFGLLAILRIMTHFSRDFTLAERIIVGVTFSALASWLTAATIVNISATLVYHGLAGGFEYPAIAALMVVVGGTIAAAAVVRSKGNPWFAAVFCWAVLAIYFRGGQEADSIALACIIAGLLVIGAAIVGLRDAESRRRWFG